ncbi:Diaminopimelate decarboxylase 1, chloroplastic [Galdieria sulphuraria]|uniref:diaminopimelate decarboxylase n=1 Tax=Galdieria sulphuraria TaxID=130081 RepID=M2XPN5_GALSU|nr:diaminopimelate decarboxylase [Galdieria sulphuraria]EME32177.1 diaminopimelate decarboxylase [Galdieria sulphuraria]GJD09601.1 Diaminopimelate decarboxylase 1, chloroplastic [Galdieria sulphuraria]|eukprot:XP_005708697.1 diaminopimelate decarboxylase [Galdieria sulphuraria]
MFVFVPPCHFHRQGHVSSHTHFQKDSKVGYFSVSKTRVHQATLPVRRNQKLGSWLKASMAVQLSEAGTHKSYIGYDKHGFLWCEELKVADILENVGTSPFFLYSKSQLVSNFESYLNATKGMDAIIGYAIKANNNLSLLRILASRGSGAVLVSGGELMLAEKAGFDLHKTVLNGNGKTISEISVAVTKECLINVDSEFDLEHIILSSKQVGKRARILIRINPDIDPQVHPYISTGLANSKFGIRNTHLEWFLNRIKQEQSYLDLVGVHCHLGSTIRQVKIFKDAATIMLDFVSIIRNAGFHGLQYLNIGGGLGIDYERQGHSIPTPEELVGSIREKVKEAQLTLIIEPGRSIVGNTGMLISRVIGVKSNGNKEFIVVDGSMAEVIRPSLYDAFHWIGLITPNSNELSKFDVVGPICESADFLGKDRMLPRPEEGSGIAIMDTGAYCYAMASNYNMRLKPAEILVDGKQWKYIRRRETFEDMMHLYDS